MSSSPRLVLTMLLLPAALGAALLLALPDASPGEAPPPEPMPSLALADPSPPEPAEAAARSATVPEPSVTPIDPLAAKNLDEDKVLGTVRAIMDGRPMLAFRYLKQLESLFPNSEHEAERERYLIEVMTKLGRKTEARERAERFMTEHPIGPHAMRVQWYLDNELTE